MSDTMRRPPSTPAPVRQPTDHLEAVQCPRCGRTKARVIGRSDAMPVVYLKCDACQLTSVAGG